VALEHGRIVYGDRLGNVVGQPLGVDAPEDLGAGRPISSAAALLTAR
jgi:hypothetical protein